MSVLAPARKIVGALFALAVIAGTAQVRAQEPTPGAIAAAKELLEVKGVTNMFDPVIPGVIETAKNTFLQTNPGLAKDLNEVAAVLRTEFTNKRTDVSNEVARAYAQQFSEKEIRDAIAFYKTPLGKKLVVEEARVLETSMRRVQDWADRFSDEVLTRLRAEMRKRGHNL